MQLLFAWDDTDDVIDMTPERFTEELFPDIAELLANDARADHARIMADIEARGIAEGVSLDGRDFVVGTPQAVTEYVSRQLGL